MQIIGFYWTLPVPWARFTKIDGNDIESAAAQSRTIALQREAVRGWADGNGHTLIHEQAYIEIAPDRGSDLIHDPLSILICKAQTLDAVIVYVDFGEAIQQRSHKWLGNFVGEHARLFEPVPLSFEQEDSFRSHFGQWRKKQRQWQTAKSVREAQARARAHTLASRGTKVAAIARRLNREGLLSPTGRDWTADYLRRFLRV